MLSGSLADRSSFWLTDTDGASEASGSPPSESEPQALSTSAPTLSVTRLSFAEIFTGLLLLTILTI